MGDLIDLANEAIYSRPGTATSPTVTLSLVYLDEQGEVKEMTRQDTRLLQGFSHLEDEDVDLMHGSYAFGHKRPDGSLAIKSHGDPRVKEHLISMLER